MKHNSMISAVCDSIIDAWPQMEHDIKTLELYQAIRWQIILGIKYEPDEKFKVVWRKHK